jgi:hypothetical protein
MLSVCFENSIGFSGHHSFSVTFFSKNLDLSEKPRSVCPHTSLRASEEEETPWK